MTKQTYADKSKEADMIDGYWMGCFAWGCGGVVLTLLVLQIAGMLK